VSPNHRDASAWHHLGFRVYTNEFAKEILGDGIGNEGSLYGLGPPITPYHICDYETCVEEPGGDHDGDGRCEAGEDCKEDLAGEGDNDEICETDYFPDAVACVTPIENQNGCVHNVEFRTLDGAKFTNASHWIVEDSEFHDMGCLNRGYASTARTWTLRISRLRPISPSDYKSDGYGLDVNNHTATSKCGATRCIGP
jgi:hypothetical protein